MPEGRVPAKVAYKTETPNASIELYNGVMNIAQSNRTFTTEGSIQLKWLPSRWVRFDIPRIARGIDTGNATIELPEFNTQYDAFVTNVSNSIISGVGHSVSCGGILVHEAILKRNIDDDSCDEVLFHLPNFKCHRWPGRINLNDGEWEVTIDQINSYNKMFESLNDQGGFAFTHSGVLKKCGKSKLSLEQANDKLIALHYFLSFVNGAWCGPVLSIGRADSKTNWEIWSAPNLTPWKSVSSWFNDVEPKTIDETFKGFMILWNDCDWRETIKTAIHWYVEANIGAGGVEGAIVLTQTALELLAWVYLIETSETPAYTVDSFEKLHADKKISLLLESMKIPTHIPKELNELVMFRKLLRERKTQKYNGPQMFTFIRNQIVHDRTGSPDKMSDIPFDVKSETHELGLWYLELVLLFLCKHRGNYCRRYVHGYHDDVIACVPWVEPNISR
jgi:hypothetical protein